MVHLRRYCIAAKTEEALATSLVGLKFIRSFVRRRWRGQEAPNSMTLQTHVVRVFSILFAPYIICKNKLLLEFRLRRFRFVTVSPLLKSFIVRKYLTLRLRAFS